MPHSNTKLTERHWRQRIGAVIMGPLFYGYLRLVQVTSRFDIENEAALAHAEVLGYWHGDSALMMILVLQLTKKVPPVDVVITADWRGDIIAYVLKRCHMNPIRTHDGLGIRKNLQLLTEACRQKDRMFATAMDGPLGPRHEVKSLLPHLAKKTGSVMHTIRFVNSSSFHIRKRWDHYAVPLPFGKIKAEVKKQIAV